MFRVFLLLAASRRKDKEMNSDEFIAQPVLSQIMHALREKS
jgi:hypothetical protein